MAQTALVVGASGIVGSAMAALLVKEGWSVKGLARNPVVQHGIEPVAADLRDMQATTVALKSSRICQKAGGWVHRLPAC